VSKQGCGSCSLSIFDALRGWFRLPCEGTKTAKMPFAAFVQAEPESFEGHEDLISGQEKC
jgi:hypothetical protein